MKVQKRLDGQNQMNAIFPATLILLVLRRGDAWETVVVDALEIPRRSPVIIAFQEWSLTTALLHARRIQPVRAMVGVQETEIVWIVLITLGAKSVQSALWVHLAMTAVVFVTSDQHVVLMDAVWAILGFQMIH